MAKLTEDQQRAFGNRMTEILGDPETAAALLAKDSGLDPSKRTAKLKTKQTAADKAEANQTKAKAKWTESTRLSVAATGDYYQEASAAAESLISELGEDHDLSKQLRNLRDGMVNEAARGPGTPPAKPV